MRLIGQFDSPFVRRVGIALAWYGLPFSQLPLSVFGDAEALAAWNPLRRVPALVLDDGTCLIDSFACLDFIDEQMRSSHADSWPRLLIAASGPARLTTLRWCALACGCADKVISLVYEQHVREQRSPSWTARCTTQVQDTLEYLERNYSPRRGADAQLSHAEIALTCLLTFTREAQPSLLHGLTLRNLEALAADWESSDEFRRIYQPFTAAGGPRDGTR